MDRNEELLEAAGENLVLENEISEKENESVLIVEGDQGNAGGQGIEDKVDEVAFNISNAGVESDSILHKVSESRIFSYETLQNLTNNRISDILTAIQQEPLEPEVRTEIGMNSPALAPDHAGNVTVADELVKEFAHIEDAEADKHTTPEDFQSPNDMSKKNQVVAELASEYVESLQTYKDDAGIANETLIFENIENQNENVIEEAIHSQDGIDNKIDEINADDLPVGFGAIGNESNAQNDFGITDGSLILENVEDENNTVDTVEITNSQPDIKVLDSPFSTDIVTPLHQETPEEKTKSLSETLSSSVGPGQVTTSGGVESDSIAKDDESGHKAKVVETDEFPREELRISADIDVDEKVILESDGEIIPKSILAETIYATETVSIEAELDETSSPEIIQNKIEERKDITLHLYSPEIQEFDDLPVECNKLSPTDKKDEFPIDNENLILENIENVVIEEIIYSQDGTNNNMDEISTEDLPVELGTIGYESNFQDDLWIADGSLIMENVGNENNTVDIVEITNSQPDIEDKVEFGHKEEVEADIHTVPVDFQSPIDLLKSDEVVAEFASEYVESLQTDKEDFGIAYGSSILENVKDENNTVDIVEIANGQPDMEDKVLDSPFSKSSEYFMSNSQPDILSPSHQETPEQDTESLSETLSRPVTPSIGLASDSIAKDGIIEGLTLSSSSLGQGPVATRGYVASDSIARDEIIEESGHKVNVVETDAFPIEELQMQSSADIDVDEKVILESDGEIIAKSILAETIYAMEKASIEDEFDETSSEIIPTEIEDITLHLQSPEIQEADELSLESNELSPMDRKDAFPSNENLISENFENENVVIEEVIHSPDGIENKIDEINTDDLPVEFDGIGHESNFQALSRNLIEMVQHIIPNLDSEAIPSLQQNYQEENEKIATPTSEYAELNKTENLINIEQLNLETENESVIVELTDDQLGTEDKVNETPIHNSNISWDDEVYFDAHEELSIVDSETACHACDLEVFGRSIPESCQSNPSDLLSHPDILTTTNHNQQEPFVPEIWESLSGIGIVPPVLSHTIVNDGPVEEFGHKIDVDGDEFQVEEFQSCIDIDEKVGLDDDDEIIAKNILQDTTAHSLDKDNMNNAVFCENISPSEFIPSVASAPDVFGRNKSDTAGKERIVRLGGIRKLFARLVNPFRRLFSKSTQTPN